MKYTPLLFLAHTYIFRFFDTTHCSCGAAGFILCPECLQHIAPAHEAPNPYITCLYNYKNKMIQEVIHALKFSGAWWYGTIFGEPLYEAACILAQKYHTNRVYIIPIPISKKRRIERGYNQCEKLLSFIEYACKRQCGSFKKTTLDRPELFFIKDSIGRSESISDDHLSRLSKSERREKIQGQFFIKNMSFIKNTSNADLIILLDDVTTTGSTLEELRKILQPHTEAFIVGLTVAH